MSVAQSQRMRGLGLDLHFLAIALAAILAGCSAESDSDPTEPGPLADPARAPVSGEGAESRSTPEPVSLRFRDITETSGVRFVHTSGDDENKYFPTANGSGVALLDYDGDGLLDLYFASTRELPLNVPTSSQGCRLYRNLGDGRFEDVTEAAGISFLGFTHGVVAGDLNNDGAPDLFLATLGPDVLFLNNGDGTFRDASGGLGETPPWSSGAALLDYDGDGLLDLYITSYGHWSEDDDHPLCGEGGVQTYCSPLIIEPARDFLLRNLGDGRFEDVTEAAGILRDDGRGLGVIAVDLNRDGLIDLYIANDLRPNFVFLNRGDGTFDDVGELSGAARSGSGDAQAGMGVDAEDLDGDGFPELIVTNFRGEHNTLYRNFGGRDFQDSSASVGIFADSLSEVGWGCALADFNNDGHPDLFVVNGHVDANLEQIGRNEPHAQPCKIWMNRGDVRFRLVADPGPFFSKDHVARGVAFGDLDNDGAIDVVINRLGGPPAILINESVRGNWIGLELFGTRSNRSAIGAVAEVEAGGRVLHRQVKGGGSYLSSNDPRLLVGLGEADRVDRVIIHWPSGAKETFTGLEPGRYHRIVEGETASTPTPTPEDSS